MDIFFPLTLNSYLLNNNMMVSRRSIKVINRQFFSSYSTVADSKEKTIKIGQCDINYLKVGKGPHQVLCIPGTLGSIWTDFGQQIEKFDRNKFSLVVWDPPGYGRSRPPLRKFNMDMYENDAFNAFALMKALRIPKYSILGWSGGGISGIIHAAKFPEAMHKLVVWGSPACILPHEVGWYRNIRDIDTWSERMKNPLLDIYGEELLKTYWSQWVDMMIAMYSERKGDICMDLLKLIKCPTFVLHGGKDGIVDPAHASNLIKNISNSRLHVYPEGKHNMHMKYVEDFNRRVQEFLQETERPQC